MSIGLPGATEHPANVNASSTPGSGNYGKHMTSEEVIDFFAPHSSTTDAVLAWLSDAGINGNRSAVSVNKQVSNQSSSLQRVRTVP